MAFNTFSLHIITQKSRWHLLPMGGDSLFIAGIVPRWMQLYGHPMDSGSLQPVTTRQYKSGTLPTGRVISAIKRTRGGYVPLPVRLMAHASPLPVMTGRYTCGMLPQGICSSPVVVTKPV